MKKHDEHPDHAELEASLERLGIRELEQRLEIAPLLMETSAAGGDAVQPNDLDVCCACKIPYPGPDGNLPYPTDDPSGGVSTGPTNPTGVKT
jgi:hypothetical protein